jgi:hypothetical protein
VSLFWSEGTSATSVSAGHKIGVSAYQECTSSLTCGTISFSAIIQQNMSENLSIESMKRSLKPTLFLLHPKILSNPDLLKAILDDEESSRQIPYQSMRSSVWSSTQGFQTLTQKVVLRADQQAAYLAKQNGYQRFASLIDLEDKVMLSSLSGCYTHNHQPMKAS